jgi:hypothetical protein
MVRRHLATITVASSLLLVAAAVPPAADDCATAGDPVDLFTGLSVREHDDLVLPGARRFDSHERTEVGGTGRGRSVSERAIPTICSWLWSAPSTSTSIST